ncbi:MAG: hypothetical protein HOI95_15860 [Chromatiales bacterium]|nr:hypothetical protein [Chromatiales bacterium]
MTTGIERSLAAVGTGLSEAGDDFDDDDSLRGRLLLVAVAPGAYEMTNWGLLLTQRDHDRRWLAPAQLPPIGVAVRRGEVVYIGNLHIAATRAEHEILPPLLRPVIAARAVISDQSDRDLTLYRQRYPGFAGWTVRASVKTRPEWSLTIQRSTAGDSTPKPSAPEKSKPDEATPAKSNTG